MKPISLVTGGAGFIGSHVSVELLKMGHQVVILDDLSGGFIENIPSGAVFIQGSVTDVPFLSKLFNTYQFDYVFHLAAYAAEGLSHFIKRYNYTNNLVGSVNLINESVKHRIKCFVFTSSIAVYGAGQVPMTEDMTPQPEDPYGISKYAVELDLKSSHEMFGLNYIVFRPHNVFGENQNIGDKYRNVVGIFMNQLLQNKPLTVFGDGEQSRAFSYIHDVSIPIARSVEIQGAYNQIFNIGADNPVSVRVLAQMVMDAMKIEGEIRSLPPRNEVMHAHSSHEKASKVFGNSSTVSLQEGLTRMALWVKEHGARKTAKFENIEIHEKLPPLWLED